MIAKLILACTLFGCAGWHLEPQLGTSYGESHPGDSDSQWVTLEVSWKKDPVVNVTVEPSPVTVVASDAPVNVTMANTQEPEATSAPAEAPSDWVATIKDIVLTPWGALFLIVVVCAWAWLASKDKAPSFGLRKKKAAKK